MAWELERFNKEMKKFDPLLRARISKTDPGVVIIERKARRETKCVPKPLERRGIDRWISDSQGYAPVTKAFKHQLNHNTLIELRAQDMWAYRGAGYFADKLEEQERAEEAKSRKEESDLLQNIGEEAYDRAMIKQGDIVSGFHQKAD